MSSLKDWYRYVESKARTRPEDAANGAEERAAGERDAGPPAGESGAGEQAPRGASLTESEAEEIRAAAGLGAGEETLDVWSGLFPQPRKPEPKPTTAPLPRPTARLDEIPPGLSFTEPPVEGPPPPQFELPEAEAAIPRFDDFVSPFTAEPAPVAEIAPSAGGPSSPVARPQFDGDFPPAGSPGEPERASNASVSAERPVADGGTAEPGSSDPERAAAPLPVEESNLAASPEELVTSGIWDGEDVEGESGQLRWRSPFRLPGPGRTVSSGAPSPKPEPVVPRPLSSAAPAEEPAQGAEGGVPGSASQTVAPSTHPSSLSTPRPAPGTEEWERERVERLARTFRDTLRALEESLGAPRTPVASPPPEQTPVEIRPALPVSPRPEPEPESVDRLADRPSDAQPASPIAAAPAAPAVDPQDSPAIAPPPAVSSPAASVTDTPPAGQPVEASTGPVTEVQSSPLMPATTFEPSGEAVPEPEWSQEEAPEAGTAAANSAAALPDGALQASEEPFSEKVAAAAVASTTPRGGAAPSPRVTSATPDVLRNIEEAALIRQRLPQHMAMLLRIPTNEVAQNSYKSPFRETREDLIGRLLDPQLTLEEAARILGVCPTTVRRYTNRGMLHCHRTPGNQRRFRMSDVLQFLEQYGDRIDRAAEARQAETAA